MKKLTALVLAMVMVFSLCACGGGSGTGSSQPSSQLTSSGGSGGSGSSGGSETPAPSDSGEVDITSWIVNKDTSIKGTVNFWIPFKGSQGMDALIADFNQTYPNITVNLNPYNNNSDGNLAVNTAILGGEVDVLASFGLNNAYVRWDNGLYVDITDRVEEEGIDLVANWGTDVYKLDDRIYTFPCGGLSYYVAINMTAWNEAGLGELPTEWTWDEYLEASRKMTKLNADGSVAVYGGSDYHSQNYPMYAYTQVYGGDLYYSDNGTKASFTDPIILQAYEREVQAELVEKIWFPKATYRADSIQAQMTFCQGQTASTVICNVTRFLHDTKTYPDVDWITGFAPWPVVEKGQTNYMSGVPTFSHAGIALNCQDEEAAWAFLKWYSTYGVKYLAAAGHQPAWKGTEAGSTLQVIYGTEEEAEKWIDVESFNRVVSRADLPAYRETSLTAYSELATIANSAAMDIINGLKTPAEALQEAQIDGDEAIRNAS